MAQLISAKVPLLNAVALVRQMINFYPLVKLLEQVEKEILRGSSLSKGLSAYRTFDSKMLAQIGIGGEVDQLELFFDRLAGTYSDEVEPRPAP